MNWRDGSSQLTRKPYFILEDLEDSRDPREEREEVRTDKLTVLERKFICSCHLPTFNSDLVYVCVWCQFRSYCNFCQVLYTSFNFNLVPKGLLTLGAAHAPEG